VSSDHTWYPEGSGSLLGLLHITRLDGYCFRGIPPLCRWKVDEHDQYVEDLKSGGH
jgi:hypothetical protein